MMLFLPLLAVALAIPPKRSASALGIFLSIVIVVAYHKVNQYAEQMASQGRVDAIIALVGAVPGARRSSPGCIMSSPTSRAASRSARSSGLPPRPRAAPASLLPKPREA